jgi:YrbI family 3-deoxy-D-manno-octulosonate 8-phosphate phosphatase
MVVISKETNPVVAARCKKLNIPALSGVDEKLPRLIQWAEQNRLAREQVVYVGNDVNDLECLSWAGCGVAVADSHRQVLDIADVILESKGGCGALRELADELAGRIQGVFPVVPSSGRA